MGRVGCRARTGFVGPIGASNADGVEGSIWGRVAVRAARAAPCADRHGRAARQRWRLPLSGEPGHRLRRTGSIGHAGNGGAGVNQSLIPGLDSPCGVAVDASTSTGRVAPRSAAPTSTATRERQHELHHRCEHACGVAVDGAHIYWGNGNAIGRADIDGNPASVNQSFITGAHGVCGVAVDPGHVYWGNFQPGPGTVGRADLDGTPASVNQNFVTGGAFLRGRRGRRARLRGNNGTGTIGRASIDGNPATVDQTFINAGSSTVRAVAVDAAHIYWTAAATGAVGRAEIDGSPGSIARATSPWSLPLRDRGRLAPRGVELRGCLLPLAVRASRVDDLYCQGPRRRRGPHRHGRVCDQPGRRVHPGESCTLGPTGAATAACQVTYKPSAAGVVSISVAYPGDANHGPSAGATALDVSPRQSRLDTKITEASIQANHNKASFSFQAIGKATGFQCALVKTAPPPKKTPPPTYRSCTSPKSYSKLKPGSYKFSVRALNTAGPDPTPASTKFTI